MQRSRPMPGYAETLRATFPTLEPRVDDLFLLEAHQVAGLPARAPAAELAAVVRAHGHLRSYLVARYPPIASWLDEILAAHPPLVGRDLLAATETLLWEVADEIVYQRAPRLYDEVSRRGWDDAALLEIAGLDGRTVIDAGAGTGVVAFAVAPRAAVVFAVEPVARLRGWMRERARAEGVGNLFVLDGTLDAVPLPPASADVLVTRRAIGWSLDVEIAEVDRLLRPGGTAVHLTGMAHPPPPGDAIEAALTAAGYRADTYAEGGRRLRRYAKAV